MHQRSKFWFFILILQVQKLSMSFKSWLGVWRMLEVPDWNLASWFWFENGHLFLFTYIPNFGSLFWFWRCKEHPCPLSPHLGLWRMLGVSDWDLASRSWIGYGPWFLVHPGSKFGLSILSLKVQRTSTSLKSWYVALEDAGDSWLGFGILILILI